MMIATRPDDPADETLSGPAPLRIGRYTILGGIGEGAMGVVYRAYDEALDRNVAIKLLRSRPGAGLSAQVRLQREAQALAQLSHPNVVQVYDVGDWHGQPFVALELVPGRTLRKWLAGRPRTWREIVDAYAQAARGLAAAHRAGLVHRDFKPDNVLVGDDGRVRVADFGLALPTGEGDTTAPGPAVSDSGRAVVRVTATGSLVGTPAYMAPEQFRHLPSDARSDQFAFCVALFEALHGYRPFAGETVPEIQRSVFGGEPLAPPPRAATPQWLGDVIRRGLAADPERRFPSMDALADELTRDRGKVRRRLAYLGVAVGLAAATVVGQVQANATCQGAAQHLRDVWDAPRRAAVEKALLATGVDYAADTWARVRSGIDAYAQSWAATHTAACQAHQRGEQSSTLLDLRMECLGRRRTELRALVDVLADADASTVMSAVQAVHALPPLAACSDTTALLDEQRRLGLPRDPATEARVKIVRSGIAQLEAMVHAGQFVRAIERSEELLREAESADYLPTLAEVQFWRARALLESGAIAEAAELLRKARLTALRADHEFIEAHALVADVYAQGYLQNFAAADAAYEAAEALIARIAPDSPLAAELLRSFGVARFSAGRSGEAEEILKSALRLRPTAATESVNFDALYNALGLALFQSGKFDEAERYYREGIDLHARSLGPEHPFTCMAETNLATLLYETDRHDEARTLMDRCLGPFLTAFGNDRPDCGDILAVRGLLRLADEPHDALAELRRAHELGERSGQPQIRSLTRFALALALWDLVPAERAQALQLARDAALDGGPAPRRQRILAWLREHEPDNEPPVLHTPFAGTDAPANASLDD